MHPVFVARGPAFKRNYVTNLTINSVDVYNLMSFILDLKPANNNGSLQNISDLISSSYLYHLNNRHTINDFLNNGYHRLIVLEVKETYVLPFGIQTELDVFRLSRMLCLAFIFSTCCLLLSLSLGLC